MGPGIEGVQIPRMRFFSGKGDSQLLKNTPSGEVNMEAIQTCKEQICGLEVVQEFQALFAIAISPVSVGFWYWAKMSGKEA